MIDHRLFLYINGLSGRSHVIDSVAVFLAVYGIYILAIAVALLSFNKKYFEASFLAFVSSVIGRLAVVEIIKQAVNRPRPFEVLKVNLLLQDNGIGKAFSSGHAVIMFAIAFSLYGTKWFWPFLVLAVISSFARIFVGVHYPLDIVASIVIAGLVVWLCRRLFKKPILG